MILMNNTDQNGPHSAANQEWIANVQASKLPEPDFDGRYNLVVVGGGPAGLVAAAGAAGLGAKVAMIESNRMGGDCLNVGCVPSKSLLCSANDYLARTRGNECTDPSAASANFKSALERLQVTRSKLSIHDSVDRFKELGVDVFLGHGKFSGPNTIQVNDRTLRFKKALIATGASAASLNITGSESMNLLTNETLFDLTDKPNRLLVIGGGAIGCEMAQAFARLGTTVVQIERSGNLLANEDREASRLIQQSLEDDGVKIHFNSSVDSFKTTDSGKQVSILNGGAELTEVADEILICIGRVPNVRDLGLELAEVEFDQHHGVKVNDFLQTTNRNIFAAGDVIDRARFTHAADFMARIVIQNALFKGRKRYSSLIIPRCTYTSPELAHVGISDVEAAANSEKIASFTLPFKDVDRSFIANERSGFMRVHVKLGTDRILGATIVNPHAGELISMITLAMTNGIGLKHIASTIFPYPTRADALRKIGDQYNRGRLTPTIKKVFEKWLRWCR
jgi:pyruvate/2-oxoglutarate dehydrogenase complex dihydrolipoamide dehydrogenase (E3) component